MFDTLHMLKLEVRTGKHSYTHTHTHTHIIPAGYQLIVLKAN